MKRRASLVTAARRQAHRHGPPLMDAALTGCHFVQKKAAPKGEKPEPVRTHLRDVVVLPEMIGSLVGVYNGKTFNQVEIKVRPVFVRTPALGGGEERGRGMCCARIADKHRAHVISSVWRRLFLGTLAPLCTALCTVAPYLPPVCAQEAFVELAINLVRQRT
jgi:ribosomal protein S19